MGEGQGLERGGAGLPLAAGGLLAAGQGHFAEQDLADLARGADVERAAGQFVGPGLQLGHAQAELGGQAPEPVGIDADAGLFHVGQHRRHAALEGFVDGDEVFLRQPRLEDAPQPQGDIGVLGRVAGGRFQGDVFERFLALARARDLFERDGVVAEMQPRQLVHPMPVQPALQHV